MSENHSDKTVKTPRIALLIGLAVFAALWKGMPYWLNLQSTFLAFPENSQDASLPYWLSSFLNGANSLLWNLSPLLPLAIFCGVYLKQKIWIAIVPLAAMLAGDIVIGFSSGHWEWAFYDQQWGVYLAFGCVIAVGILFHKYSQKPWLAMCMTGAVGGALFFLISNFVVWKFGDPAIFAYSRDFSGLLDCYLKALPFYRGTLFSMAVFLPVLFSQVGLVEVPAMRKSEHGLRKELVEVKSVS